MKTIYLVRHAKSSWDFPNLSDFDRPLNKRGKSNAPEMGKRLKKMKIIPDLLLASPANRALSTAVAIADAIGYPNDKIKTDEDIYHAGETQLLSIINNVKNEVGQLMLFGHNPGFTDLANILGNEWIDNVPTCGVVCLEFDVELWSEISPKTGTIKFFDYPKNTG